MTKGFLSVLPRMTTRCHSHSKLIVKLIHSTVIWISDILKSIFFYPVHSKEDAWPSLRIAKVGVLQPWTLPQPGPLKLTRFPLCSLVQVILHEVCLLIAGNILPLLSSIVIRWKYRAKRKGEGEWEREEGINKPLQCPARRRPLIKEAWQKMIVEKKTQDWIATLCPQRGFPSQHALQGPNRKKGDKGSEDED